MSLNITKSTQTCQTKSKKSLSIQEKAYISIGIPLILYGVCYKTHTTIAKEADTNRQSICELTSKDPNIMKINRGVKKSCLHNIPNEYTTIEGLMNDNKNVVKEVLLKVFLSNLIQTEILRDTTRNLRIKARSFFAKFSDRALNDSYVNMMKVSNGVLEYFDNVAGYFYTACMKYHKDYEIPLLF